MSRPSHRSNRKRFWRSLLAITVVTSLAAFLSTQTAAHAAGGTATGADLQMSGSASNGSPHAGDTFTLTYLVKNNGPQTATGASFVDPDAFMVTGATVNGNAGACTTGVDAVTGLTDEQCNLGDMAPGAQLTVVETAVASCGCQLVLSPTVTSTVTDPNLTNNTPAITIKVQSASTSPPAAGGGSTTPSPSGADIQVSGSSNLGSVTLGQAYTYTYQVKNAGPASASSVTFTDDLTESGSAFAGQTPGAVLVAAAVNGDPTPCASASDGAGGTTVACTMSISAGSGATVTLSVDAPTTEPAAGSYTNTGTVTSTLTDPNTANNSTAITVQVVPLVDGPCATMTVQSPPSIRVSTAQGSSSGIITMNATVTSCSSLIQSPLVVGFSAVPGSTFGVFSCIAPPSPDGSATSFSLPPGATMGLSCSGVPYLISGVTPAASGTGTATLYSGCTSWGLESVFATTPSIPRCTTVLASGPYFWSVITGAFVVQPAPPPNCPRAGCIVF